MASTSFRRQGEPLIRPSFDSLFTNDISAARIYTSQHPGSDSRRRVPTNISLGQFCPEFHVHRDHLLTAPRPFCVWNWPFVLMAMLPLPLSVSTNWFELAIMSFNIILESERCETFNYLPGCTPAFLRTCSFPGGKNFSYPSGLE
jgi:ribosomal protein L33